MSRCLRKLFFLSFQVLFKFVLIFTLCFNNSVCCCADGVGGLHVNPQCCAILIDALTGDVLFEKDADRLAAVASTTKIMSTMVVLENCSEDDLDRQFVVDAKAINEEGTSMGLQPGDVVTMRDLCYGMLLRSGNDAANAAAVKIAGSVPKFVELMNEKARQLGCTHTVFTTPSGLETGASLSKPRSRLTQQDMLKFPHSTAREMAIITRAAMKNDLFRKICATKSTNLYFGNPPYKRFLKNHNKLLSNLEGCCGVKTGFTDVAGRCLVSAINRNGVTLIAVVLNDADDWVDSKNMLLYGLSKFKRVELSSEALGSIKPVALKEDECEFEVGLKEPAYKFLAGDMDKRVKSVVRGIDGLQFLPIEEGEKLGEIDYYLDGQKIAKVDVISKSRINSDEALNG